MVGTTGVSRYEVSPGTLAAVKAAPNQGPRQAEANAIAALLVYAILKQTTDDNAPGLTSNRPNALQRRSGNTLRMQWVNGANGITADIGKAFYRAFQDNTAARKALCHIAYNVLIVPGTAMGEAIASQAHLLVGAGSASVLRAGAFICAFPEVVQSVAELAREATEVARMLETRALEPGPVQAFGGQMYRDGYYTTEASKVKTLTTIAILLERKRNTSAGHLVVPLAAGPLLTACTQVADGIEAATSQRLSEFAAAAAQISTA